MSIFTEYKGKLPKKILDEVKEQTKGMSEQKTKKVMEAVFEEYENARIEPGECIGIVSAESIGEPGTQMSIDYGEQVIVKSQAQVKIVKIGEFIDRIMDSRINYAAHNDTDDGTNNTDDTTELCNLANAELFVPALSQNEKIEWKKVTAVSRHKSPERLLRIKTRSGRQITATPYHSFVLRKNNSIVAAAGSNLRRGDRIPSARHIINLTNNGFLKLENYLPKSEYIYESELRKAINKESDFILPLRSYEQINNYAQGNNKLQLKQNCVYMYQHHGVVQIPEILELDYLSGFFIGAYLAEGTLTKHCVAIANISEQYLQQVVKFAEKYNINYRIRYDIGEYGKSTTLVLNSALIADLLNKACGRGAYGKHLPSFAYSAKSEFVSALLNAYFSGDGNVNVLRRVIRASSCSRQLIDGVSILLSQFGIFAVKSAGKRNQYTLSISYRYAGEFNDKIGMIIPGKKAELERLANIQDSKTSSATSSKTSSKPSSEAVDLKTSSKTDLNTDPKTSYDLVDMVPGYGDILSVLGKKLGIPGRLTNKFTNKQRIGRQTLKKYIALFEEKAESGNMVREEIEEELKILKRMLNSDVVWDEIVGLDYITPTNRYVYDFSVEDLETFTTFDGIITHNTLNTFHFAGVAEMNITMGLPRIIEILDGRSQLKTPMMEIYLKPDVKGSDIRKIALSIKETLMESVVSEFLINIADSSIELKLDTEKMEELGITESLIAESLKKVVKGYSTKATKDSIILKPKEKGEILNKVYLDKEKIKKVHLTGVKGISQVLPVRRGEDYVIITSGTNLNDVLELDYVDSTRVTTNDIFEIEHVLGIEAARQAIIDELFKVIESQGLDVDIRHIMLVADTMCNSGEVKGITRYGVVSQKSSVLAKASFETPIKHIVNAALVGEEDRLTSVVENVMLNQPVPVGTGLPELVTKVKR